MVKVLETFETVDVHIGLVTNFS